MNEKISIIIPVYNVEKYLKRCLDSVINQTYKDLEIILIDDGSTDLSSEICDNYAKADNRIKVFHSENKGVSAARNKGLELASGQWIGFIDPDDWINEDMYETLYTSAKKYKVNIAVCAYKSCKDYISGATRFSKNDFLLLNAETSMKFMLVDDTYCGAIWNKLYKKDLLTNKKFKEGMIIGEDVLFNFNLLFKRNVKTVYNRVPKYNYFYRTDSVMNKSNIDKRYFSQLEVRKKIAKEIIQSGNASFINEYNLKYCRILLNLLLKACKNNTSNHKFIYCKLKKENKDYLKIKKGLRKKETILLFIVSLPYNISTKIMSIWNKLKFVKMKIKNSTYCI